eukprot:GSChrysophyteH1.ASY1.ANO1.661.1 assembled CDS
MNDSLAALHSHIEGFIAEAKHDISCIKQGRSTAGQSVTSKDIISGLRGKKVLWWELSSVCPSRGLIIRGHSIDELRKKLPLVDAHGEQFSEGLLWLLLTGCMPSSSRVVKIQQLLLSVRTKNRSVLSHACAVLNSLDTTVPALVQLSIALSAIGSAHNNGGTTPRKDLWKKTLSDAIQLLSLLPTLAGVIIKRRWQASHRPSTRTPQGADFGSLLAEELLHTSDPTAAAFVRLYLMLHCDHGGGNASAHTARIAHSAGAPAASALSAAMLALNGPLHGGAAAGALSFMNQMSTDLGNESSKNRVVIPGFGHAVLRQTDPRAIALMDFGREHVGRSRSFQLAQVALEAVPKALAADGRASSPWANVDAVSGLLLQAVLEKTNCRHALASVGDIIALLFGISRSFGILSQLVLDSAVELPLERPDSTTLQALLPAGVSGRSRL